MQGFESGQPSDRRATEQVERHDRPNVQLERLNGDGYRTSDGGFANGASTPRELPPLRIAMNDNAVQRAGAERPSGSDGRYSFTERDYSTALQKAADEGKPVVVKVGTDWCGPCNQMKHGTMKDASVQENLRKNYVHLDVNADQAQALAQQLGVRGYPTTIMAAVERNANGELQLKPIANKSGYLDANNFNRFLNETGPAADRVMDANGFTGTPAPDRTTDNPQRPERPDVQDAPRNEDRRIVENPDGSAVQYIKLADGKEYPAGVRFPDGRVTGYRYDNQGRLNETVDFDANGRQTLNFKTTDGVNWTETQGRAPNMSGDLRVRPDGTHIFTDSQAGTTFVRKPDGAISITDRSGQEVWSSPPIQPRRVRQ